jgi:hypothetical protein
VVDTDEMLPHKRGGASDGNLEAAQCGLRCRKDVDSHRAGGSRSMAFTRPFRAAHCSSVATKFPPIALTSALLDEICARLESVIDRSPVQRRDAIVVPIRRACAGQLDKSCSVLPFCEATKMSSCI